MTTADKNHTVLIANITGANANQLFDTPSISAGKPMLA